MVAILQSTEELVNNTTRVLRTVYRLSVPSNDRHPEDRAPKIPIDDCTTLGNRHARTIYIYFIARFLITNGTVLWFCSIVGLFDSIAHAARCPGSWLIPRDVLPNFMLVFTM